MARSAVFKNGGAIGVGEIPFLALTDWRDQVVGLGRAGLRLVALPSWTGGDGRLRVAALLADDAESDLHVLGAEGDGAGARYPAMTLDFPEAHLFERELHEETGIVPEGHPWLKPVRRGESGYPYYALQGDEVHEVAVGPVHAGVIEPGHFRFQCHGETVYHLEIQLGYQHRGVEALLRRGPLPGKAVLAESIAGDTAIGHASAYAWLLEALSDRQPPMRAQWLRALALELERMGMHLAGLSGVAADIACLPGGATYGRLRTTVINTSLAICGSRFGRSWVRPGGVLFDVDEELVARICANLDLVENDLEIIDAFFFESPSVLSRLEGTGRLSAAQAVALGLVGPAARACGVRRDVRRDHPLGAYRYVGFHPVTLDSGDCFARAKMRALELRRSAAYIRELLETLPAPPVANAGKMQPAGSLFAAALLEGWRGEVAHVAVTGRPGETLAYKVKDPSFHNWFALAQAVRGNGISDFPLCNKSFDLSYAGHDL